MTVDEGSVSQNVISILRQASGNVAPPAPKTPPVWQSSGEIRVKRPGYIVPATPATPPPPPLSQRGRRAQNQRAHIPHQTKLGSTVQPITPFFKMQTVPHLSEWPCDTRNAKSVLCTKPVLLQELEAVLLGEGTCIERARRCFAKLIANFSVYGDVLGRIRSAYEDAVADCTPAASPPPPPQSPESPTPHSSIDPPNCLSGFLKSASRPTPEEGDEVAVLVAQVRKLERQLLNYKKEVTALSRDSLLLNAAVSKVEELEGELVIQREKHRGALAAVANQTLAITKHSVLREEAQKEADELRSAIESMRAHGSTTARPMKWRAKARLSRLSSIATEVMDERNRDVISGTPTTPRPQYTQDMCDSLEFFGIEPASLHTEEVVTLLYEELVEVSAKHTLLLVQQDAGKGENALFSRDLLEENPVVALPLRLFKPLGEPSWLPAYLHSSAVRIRNLVFTLGDTLHTIRDLHQCTKQGVSMETFFAERGKPLDATMSDVAYSFLHALHLYNEDPTCALMRLVVLGYVGSWVIDTLVADVLKLEDGFRRSESGVEVARRAGVYLPALFVKGGTVALPEVVSCIDSVFGKRKDIRALLQLKHAVFIDGRSSCSVAWPELFSVQPNSEDATEESAFLTTLKRQWVNELLRWLHKFELALLNYVDTEIPPQITRGNAKKAISEEADPLSPACESSAFVDSVFESSIAYSQGKAAQVTATSPSLWTPFPTLKEDAGTMSPRYDTMARLYSLDMGLRPSPFTGVARHRHNPSLDVMVVSEFLHFARHLRYVPSTYPGCTVLPQKV